MLSLLLVNSNHVTQSASLIDELWSDKPPMSAVTTLQTYVYQLRRILGDAESGADRMLVTRSAGYEGRIPPEAIDLCHFENLAKQGSDALLAGEPLRASEVLREALDLWRGPALIDVPRGQLLEAQAIMMEENRLNALEMRIDADLQLRRHREVISELKGLIAGNPLSEAFYSRLMRALYLSNRRDEALEAYRKLHRTLAAELGLEPSRPIQQLHHALLADDPASEDPTLAEPGEPHESTTLVAPRQPPPPAELPPDIGDFVGRGVALKQIRDALEATEGGQATRIVGITGMPGVGKSVLAAHIGHQIRTRFDGGQLWINLGGSTLNRADPGDVLASVLRTVGFDDGSIPRSTDERARLFRTWSASRKLLVFLDDAFGALQVRPLLPTGPESAVIITSRLPIYGLGASEIVHLAGFDMMEGMELLARIAGRDRVAREPQSAQEIVTMCDGLPLGIRISGERLAVARHWTITRFAKRFADEENRLAELSCGDSDLRSRFHHTFHGLDEEASHVLRLLAAHRRCVTADTVASMAGIGAANAERLLSHLASAGLVIVSENGIDGPFLYRVPELAGLYATELAGTRPKGGPQFDLGVMTSWSGLPKGEAELQPVTHTQEATDV
ncbi:winged helix-turn-helix domain-containing protein [Actinomadura barringtoniae]|uniref:Winged helix-turn-helix domain-containing protein n=1 Tax=Actinomadura barringtoniae TaxID=1427535 RepID=A0A939P696_9ACTN|nr:winged helix-turn-helix domain-containing protein [Actinomadura barringtoniae]